MCVENRIIFARRVGSFVECGIKSFGSGEELPHLVLSLVTVTVTVRLETASRHLQLWGVGCEILSSTAPSVQRVGTLAPHWCQWFLFLNSASWSDQR